MNPAHRFRCSLLVLCALSASVGASAQTVDGVLLEKGTDHPIDLALVSLVTLQGDSVVSVLSDEKGRFHLVAPQGGEYRLAASALGYRPTISAAVLTLPDSSSMTLQFRIDPRPVEIAGLTIEMSSPLIRQPKLVRNGFVDRAQAGFGRFITPVDIARTHSVRTSDLLAATGRVTTRYALGGDRILMRGSRGYCTPQVYLDGVQINLSDTPVDVIAPLTDLDGAEVYRSTAEAPAQFGGGLGGCGVILLWTKGGGAAP